MQDLPLALNPTLSCVNRIRRLFIEIVIRRFSVLSKVRKAEADVVARWAIETHINTIPVMALGPEAIKSVWADITVNEGIRSFVMSVTYELRVRGFDVKDFDDYVDNVACGVSQFNDELSLLEDDLQTAIPAHDSLVSELSGNPWMLVVLLFEQIDPYVELGLDKYLIARSGEDGQV